MIAPDSPFAVEIIADLNKMQGQSRFIGREFVSEHDPTPYEMMSMLDAHLAKLADAQLASYSHFVRLRDSYRKAVVESVIWRSLLTLPMAAVLGFCIVVWLKARRAVA